MSVPMYLTNSPVRHQMSVAMHIPRVVVGETLILEIRAQDPTGIKQISVECYYFSLWNSTRCKNATGEFVAPEGSPCREESYRIAIPIPVDAATGKWGIRSIRFVNGRNYASTFYRGQDRFDGVVFEVLPLPADQEVALRFDGVNVVTPPDE